MISQLSKLSPKSLIACSVIAILLLGGGLWLAFKPAPVKSGVIPSRNPLGNQSQESVIKSTKPSGDQSTNQNTPAQANQNSPSTTGPAPTTPYGNFISNHHPGGDTSTAEASTCNTSAGAVCYIQFTQGSTTKKLDSQTTNANGAAIWYWDIKTAGLTSGSWTVTAIATLNGQTKTANDSQPLVVQ